MPKLSPSRTVPSGEVRATVRAAGAVPTTGAPQASYPAGTYDFETHILIIGADPVINRGAFPGRLSETIRELVPGATSFAASNAIIKGSQITVLIPPPIAFRLVRPLFVAAAAISAANIGTVLGSPTGSLPAALTTGLISAIMAGSSAYRITDGVGSFPVKGRWVTITGRLGATSTWTVANLNRAIARAFANNVTWQDIAPAYGNDGIITLHPFPAPNDGNPLLDALSESDACTGGYDYEKVYAAACTRVGVATAVTTLGPSAPGSADYMKPTTQGTASYTKPSTATVTPPTSAIQPRPPAEVTTTPVPSPLVTQPSPPTPSRTGTYVAVGAAAAAIGLMWWQRKAIFG